MNVIGSEWISIRNFYQGVLQKFERSQKKLTAVLIMLDSSYLSDGDPVTRPANDFLEVKTKIIAKNEVHCMVLLYIERLEPDNWCIQYQCS